MSDMKVIWLQGLQAGEFTKQGSDRLIFSWQSNPITPHAVAFVHILNQRAVVLKMTHKFTQLALR